MSCRHVSANAHWAGWTVCWKGRGFGRSRRRGRSRLRWSSRSTLAQQRGRGGFNGKVGRRCAFFGWVGSEAGWG
eukprot:197967-Pleurochrysis_carterae.AAC.2